MGRFQMSLSEVTRRSGSYQCRSGLRRRIGARRTSRPDQGNVKFKLDENIPVELVTDLCGLGQDADTVTGEGLGGAADPAVVDAAFAADRILFTLDKGRRQSTALPDS
jgi:hypothetical protein